MFQWPVWGNCLSANVVVSQQVDSVGVEARDGVLRSELLNTVTRTRRSFDALDGGKVGSKTGNVGRSHGSTGETSGATAGPGGKHIDGRADNVDAPAVVGARVLAVVDVGSSNGASRSLRGRGDVADVDVVVASSNGDKVALVDETASGVVESLVACSAQRHVDDHAVGAVASGSIGGDVVETRDDGVVGSNAASWVVVVVQNLDAVQAGLLGYAVGAGTNSSCNVGAVAAVVSVARDE